MARPAGYSSDELSDDDGLSCSLEFTRRPRPNPPPTNGNTSKEVKLIQAILQRNLEEVQNFVKNGANVNHKADKFKNWSALMYACFEGNFDIVKFLLESGASPSLDHEKLTPLLCLCDSLSTNEDELIKCLEILVSYKCDLNSKDWYGANALIYAVKRNHQKLIMKLLSLGCDINSADTEGWTPIFHAVSCGNVPVVQTLKEMGAKLRKLDRRGNSLADIALEKNYPEIEALLSGHKKEQTVKKDVESEKNEGRKSGFEYILQEIPDRSLGRLHGFHSDAIQWISGIGLGSLVKTFQMNNVQLNEILAADEDSLRRLGVTRSFDRRKILYSIQKFHEHNWGKNSIQNPDAEKQFDLCKAANTLVAVLHHLHICNAATLFCKKHTTNQLSPKEMDYVRKSQELVKYIANEGREIYQIARRIGENDKLIPCDLINTQKKKGILNFKLIILACASVMFLTVLKTYAHPISKSPIRLW